MSAPEPHSFDAAVALEPLADGRWLGRTHPGYANMVGPFGGITAAQALAAVLRAPERVGEPVAATFNFCAPVADGPFQIDARAVRTNRTTQHWSVTLQQAGGVVMTATVVSAIRREGFTHDEHGMPAVAPPEALPRAGGSALNAAWLQRYDMRVVEGSLPAEWDGAERDDSRSRLWVRDDPPRALDAAALTALADVFFPRIWRRRARPVPVGTVSMTVYYHADAALLAGAGDGWLLAQAQGQAFRGGFHDQTAQLWRRDGALLATTHQVVYFKTA